MMNGENVTNHSKNRLAHMPKNAKKTKMMKNAKIDSKGENLDWSLIKSGKSATQVSRYANQATKIVKKEPKEANLD